MIEDNYYIVRFITGFTSKHEVSIRNMSSVPVTFSICIPDDGDEPAVTYETFINTTNNISVPPIFPSNPREFFISPNNTTLAANTSLSIKVKIQFIQ